MYSLNSSNFPAMIPLTSEKISEFLDFIPVPILISSVKMDSVRINESGRNIINSLFGSEDMFIDQMRNNYGLYRKIMEFGNVRHYFLEAVKTKKAVKDCFVTFCIGENGGCQREITWLMNISPVCDEFSGSVKSFVTAIEDVSEIFNYNREINYSLKHLEGVIEAFAKERIAYLFAYGQEETVKHLLEVRVFSKMIADSIMKDVTLKNGDPEYLKITPLYIRMLELSALLHDFGKVKPEINSVIMQPRKLTDSEYETVKKHTIVGSDLIGLENEMLKMCWLVTRHHHEKWDGSGYPDGLSGRDIPLSSRIVAFADMVSALKNKRVYKDAISDIEEIKKIFIECRHHYDPIVFAHGMMLLEDMHRKSKYIENAYKDFELTSGYIVDLLTDVFKFLSDR